jgi:hypothetical protein
VKQTQNIFVDSIVVHNEGNIVSDMDGEKVMLSIQNGKYYNLGEIGGGIWDMIKSPISVVEITELLLTEFDVEENECRNQVISFLEELSFERLITIKEANGK